MTPGEGNSCPVDDLEEGDEAESKAKSKEAAKGRDELDRSHSYSPLHLCYKKYEGIKCYIQTSRVLSFR